MKMNADVANRVADFLEGIDELSSNTGIWLDMLSPYVVDAVTETTVGQLRTVLTGDDPGYYVEELSQ